MPCNAAALENSIAHSDLSNSNVGRRQCWCCFTLKHQRRRKSCYATAITTLWIAASVGMYLVAEFHVVRAERAYPHGCSLQDPSYYDYKNAVFPPPGVAIRAAEEYMLVRRLGAGKFSDVFEAVDRKLETAVQRNDSNKSSTATASSGTESIHPQTMVVLKCLKPVNEQKIKRELLVLQHASKLPNLARLLAIVVPPAYYPSFHHAPATGGEDSAVGPPAVPSNNNTPRLQAMPTLVLEHAHGEWLSHPKQHMLPHHQEDAPSHSEFLTEDEIRFFIFHLLVALDSLHACGIMHRDVKPRNVLINRTKKTLMLIDLGLADFYFASTPTAQEHKYNVRVASRHYKSPELLLGYQQYGTAIDLWGVGCILAGLLLRKEPFFRGKDNLDQLATIVAVLGTANLHLYMAKYNIEMTPEIQSVIAEATLQGRGAQRPWVSFLDTSTSSPSSMTPHPSAEGLDLLSKLLQYDHEYRLTAKEAMQHPFFDPVRMSIQRGLFEERAAMMQD